MSKDEIGIVLVSHVPALAQGLVTLIKEVAQDVTITFAGGTEENEVGTSLVKIQRAFQENTCDKLLAFYDLGSAKMNLEMAMEMTEKDIRLYDTAFVEGSYTAAALLQAGAELGAVEEQVMGLKVK